MVGAMRHRIILEKVASIPDGMLGMEDSYSTVDTIWGEIVPLKGLEQIESMKEGVTITHRIKIRYRKDIKGEWRIKFGDRYFNIISIVNVKERNEYLDLICKEEL